MNKTVTSVPKGKLLYFDIMNILSCIAVIALHHNGIVHSFENTRAWKESLVIECSFYWAVPVFLMISGANLLNYRKKYSTHDFAIKRIKRTVIPWLSWSIIFLILQVCSGKTNLGDQPLKEALRLIFTYKVQSVYWFFGALFACYLVIPVLSYLADKREILWYITILNFIFVSCIPIAKKLFGFPWTLDVPVTGSLVIFILLGYLLNTCELSKKIRYVLYLLGFLSLSFRFIYTYTHSISEGTTDTSIKGYATFHSVFLAVAVFVFLKQIKWEKFIKPNMIPYISTVSSCSFGVYLIHKFVKDLELLILPLNDTDFVWRIFMIPVTYFFSLIIIIIIKKIPVLRAIV